MAINSQPPGATVFIDNHYVGVTGVTPVQSPALWPGAHSLKLEKYGYLRLSRRVDFGPDFDSKRPIRLRPAACGTALVLSEPAECDVYLDGRRCGATPLRLEGVGTGAHELLVTQPGFIPSTQMINVPASQVLKVSVKLESKTEEYLLAQLTRNPKDFLSHVELLHLYLINGKLDKAKATLVAVLRLWTKEGTDPDTAARLDQEIRKAYFAEYDLGGEAALEPVRATLNAGLEEVAFGPGQGGSAQVGLLLASLLESAEKLDAARAVYERLQSKWSGDIDVKRAYGLLLHRLQRLPEAAKALQEVVTARPGDAQAHRVLAAVFVGMNKPDEALKALLHGAEIEGLPAQEKIAFETQLAAIYHSQNNFKLAAERWEKAWPASDNADQQAELQMAAAMEHNLAANKARAKELYALVLKGGAAAGLKGKAKDALNH